MADKKTDYGVEFVNIDLKFKPDLYFSKEDVIPDANALLEWITAMAGNFYRFGFSYNERSSSYTCSCTYKGGKTTDTPPCLTQHGKSAISALLKVYVVMELCGGAVEGFKFASDAVSQLETYVEDAVKKLM